MAKALTVDLFAEDRAHEEFLGPLVRRIAAECGVAIELRVRSARGGYAPAIRELKTYQRLLLNRGTQQFPDLLVVAMDSNCKGIADAQKRIRNELDSKLRNITIEACPDPHIERWFLADLESFHHVVGITPSVPQDKCVRDYYKGILAKAVIDAGHPPTLGGIEFATELIQQMDFYRAGKADSSFKTFISAAKGAITQRAEGFKRDVT